MKKEIIAALYLTASVLSLPIQSIASEEAEQIELISGEQSCCYTGYSIDSSDGKELIILLFDYTNSSATPQMFGSSFFIEAYQNGLSLEMGFPDFDSESNSLFENIAKNIKDGATIQTGYIYELQDTESPVDIRLFSLTDFFNPVEFTIDLTHPSSGDNEITSEPADDRSLPTDYDGLLTLYLDLQSKYSKLEEDYNDLLSKYNELSGLNESASENGNNSSDSDSPVTYHAGMYKVGSDIASGEYVLFASRSSGYFSISSDSSGSFNSIIGNGNFDTFTIVTISDGQYLELSRSYAVPIENVPVLDTTSSGTFKIGYHLPAGEYRLEAENGHGYYAICSNSLQTFDSIIANDNFENNAYISVSDGQYLELSRCHIVL